jgi:hypothetical protein
MATDYMPLELDTEDIFELLSALDLQLNTLERALKINTDVNVLKCASERIQKNKDLKSRLNRRFHPEYQTED